MKKRRAVIPENILKIVDWEFDKNGKVVCRKITFRRINDR